MEMGEGDGAAFKGDENVLKADAEVLGAMGSHLKTMKHVKVCDMVH